MKLICVGAQKAGTTTLDALIRKYATDVEMPRIKETKFFLDEQFGEYNKGKEFYYNKYYTKSTNGDNRIEIDPEYLYFEDCADRIYDFSPDSKILIIVRDPIKRAISHYQMSKNRGYESLDFEEAIDKENERISRSFFEKNHFSYLTRGKYKNQISRFVERFGNENVKVVSFEYFVRNQREVLLDIASFAKFDVSQNILPIKENSASSPRFKLVRHIINDDNMIKKMASLVIKNKFLKMKIGGFITRINSKPGLEKTIVSEKQMVFLRSYFNDDIKYLASKYGIEY